MQIIKPNFLTLGHAEPPVHARWTIEASRLIAGAAFSGIYQLIINIVRR